MSVVVSRRCVTAGGLTLALVLSSPLAALADPAERSNGQRGQQQSADAAAQQDGRGPAATPSATPTPAAQGGIDRTQTRRDDRPKTGKAGGDRRRASGRTPAPASTPSARTSGGQDPRGNNGTIKIDGAPFDDSKGNEPHVGCDVRLVFWGFDAGDTASITFTGQAPTGGGLLHSETGTLISRDAAGGGQDLDEALVYSLDGALSELRSIAPHPQQGWHVKVAVDVDGAPGGAKQKVFWMSCPATTAAGAAAASPTPSAATVGTAGGGATTVSPARGAQQGATAPTAPGLGAPGLTLGSGSLEVTESAELAGTTAGAASLGESVTAAGGSAAGGSGAGASARAADRPSALPFTGPVALGLLTALGVGSVAAGGLAHRLGRRRSTVSPV